MPAYDGGAGIRRSNPVPSHSAASPNVSYTVACKDVCIVLLHSPPPTPPDHSPPRLVPAIAVLMWTNMCAVPSDAPHRVPPLRRARQDSENEAVESDLDLEIEQVDG